MLEDLSKLWREKRDAVKLSISKWINKDLTDRKKHVIVNEDDGCFGEEKVTNKFFDALKENLGTELDLSARHSCFAVYYVPEKKTYALVWSGFSIKEDERRKFSFAIQFLENEIEDACNSPDVAFYFASLYKSYFTSLKCDKS